MNVIQGCECCGCNAIHDVCIRAKSYRGSETQGAGLVIHFGDNGVGNDPPNAVNRAIVFIPRSTAFGTEMIVFKYASPSLHGTYADGDELQIKLFRSGADCTGCNGDFYTDDFSGTLDAGWVENNTWAISGGRLERTFYSTLPGFNFSQVLRKFDCISGSATYTVKYCVNGVEIHSDTITDFLSTSGHPHIYAGIVGPPTNPGGTLCQADDFYMDITT
jgi:hypothetical protein